MIFTLHAVFALLLLGAVSGHAAAKTCNVAPLGHGKDDTDQVCPSLWDVCGYAECQWQVEAAIARCGHFGTTVFAPGEYNITR